LLPTWVYGAVGRSAVRQCARERGCWFPHLERAIGKLAPRPLLMIHGGADTYINPDMAQTLYERAGQPKELWLVDGAKHNQALQVAGDEYHRRVLGFFRKHLASVIAPEAPAEIAEPTHNGGIETTTKPEANGQASFLPVPEDSQKLGEPR
jgi:hypothetical protein